MRYSGSLVKKEREQIFSLFMSNQKLKFSEIEDSTGMRSNMLAYHLVKLEAEGILVKKGFHYSLTPKGEKYIPMFSNVIGKELSAAPALLVAVVQGSKVLLLRRDKRPYKGYFGVIGGKLKIEESIEEGSLRLAREKCGIDCKFISSNAVMHERVFEKNKPKHGFLMIFTVVRPLVKKAEFARSVNAKWVDLKDISKENIIASDAWLIRNKRKSRCGLINSNMFEENGRIKDFEIY